MTLLLPPVLLIALIVLAYLRAPLWQATLLSAAALIAALLWAAPWPVVTLHVLAVLIFTVLMIPALRRALISRRLFKVFKSAMPSMSETEQQALESGTTWWDAELFTGRPRWRRLLDTPKPFLSAEEQAFLDGPVEELCTMLEDWSITQEFCDLPREVWDFILKERFFSMIIPDEYGGLGFSAQANGAVVTKISSRCLTAAVTVMVPNSLGPGELLIYFGTDEQKKHYLPRLARGEDIPCFALTSPLAGSDATAMPDEGIACKGEYEGREVLGFRVNWDKRYITLAPVATLIGLAFRALDPDGLLGDEEEPGITCALVPADTPGVETGKRHIPIGSVFMNGPTRGKDVFVPMEWVIGGRDKVGQGWPMLMHCLAAGRAISLPAQSVAGGKLATMLTGAYARIRYQFKQPIGFFEGVEEPLARIAGETYRMEAVHKLTLSALDEGEKPVVLTAILKAYLTEAHRNVINDAMDVHGGKTVIEGPKNYLADVYHSIPVAITVEGANILTRTMIVFGQGSIRCHPYLLKEMRSANEDDAAAFDRALWGHAGFLLSNLVRAPLLGLSGGRLSRAAAGGPGAQYYRRINRLSAAFTLIADLCLMILGGKFKFKEKHSGRLADALSYLYMASAVLKRFEDDGRPGDDVPVMRWAVEDSLHRVEEALHGVLRNFPLAALGPLLRALVFPLGRAHPPPSDRTGQRVARLITDQTPTRDRLISGAYQSSAEDTAGLVLKAFEAVLRSRPAEAAIKDAFDAVPSPANVDALTARALEAGVISEQQAADVRRAQALIAEVIAVDEFEPEEIGHSKQHRPARAAGGG